MSLGPGDSPAPPPAYHWLIENCCNSEPDAVVALWRSNAATEYNPPTSYGCVLACPAPLMRVQKSMPIR